MAKRKKGSKPKRAKLPKRGKPRKAAKSAATKRKIATAKPKRRTVKKAEVAPAVEVPVEPVEQQEPGAAS
jgi:hypothetical protein